MSAPLNLADLSAYVILEILRYLDATSLYLLGRTCTHFDEIIRTGTSLWRRIDARRAPNDRTKLSYCLDRCYERTHTFLARADSQLETLISDEYFGTIRHFRNLVIVSVENQKIDGERYRVSSFPAHLHELSLKKTVVTNPLQFFKDSGDKFPDLRVLILDECTWLTSSAFMPISKYVSLEILSVYKCRNIENSIAYLSLSGQGFKQLKIFDARLSPLGNTLIRSLYKSPSLLAIYLQNEDISYKLDYFKRKLDIVKGAPTRDFFVEDDEFDLDDSLINEENGLNYESPTDLDDRGLLDYVSAFSVRAATGLPESVLYLDPYNECTCRLEERQKNIRNKPDKEEPPKDSCSDDSDDSDDQGGGDLPVRRKLSDKVVRLSRIIRRSQANSTYSRGLFNHNHPRSPGEPNTVLTIHNVNGDMYTSMNDPDNNVCLMDLSALQSNNRRGRRSPPDRGVPKSRIYEVMFETYMPNKEFSDSDDDDDYVVKITEQRRKEKPTSYYHRDRCRNNVPPQNDEPRNADSSESNHNSRARVRRLIDAHIVPRDVGGESSDTTQVTLKEAAAVLRKRLNEPCAGGDSTEPLPKRARADEPGPSGLNVASSESDDDVSLHRCMERPPTPHPDVAVNNPPPEKREAYRRIYFGNWPVVQIENLQDIRKDVPVPLRRLSLRGYKKITNMTLDYIKDLDLELLDLTYTNVSVDAIHNYLVDHPFCRIVHERFCVCPTNLHF